MNAFLFKKNTFQITSWLSVFLFFIALNSAQAQLPALCKCLDIENLETKTACNNVIANSFAPLVYQLQGNNVVSASGDRFVELDFDNTVQSGDNWENVGQALFDPWSVYYAVHWVNNYWYITYSFFYPRDWAQTGIIFCEGDEHENDLQRIVVRVKRPTCDNPLNCEGYNFQSDMAVFAFHHFDLSVGGSGCGKNLELALSGLHPKIYISSGSHAIYLNAQDACIDSPAINPCNPGADGFELVHPPIYQVTGMEESIIGGCLNSIKLPKLGISPYNLIDVTDPVDGMWQFRNDASVFDQNSLSFTDDKFRCTAGGGCPSKSADAPWHSWGLDPSILIKECKNNIAEYTDKWLFFSPYSPGKVAFKPILGEYMDLSQPGLHDLEVYNVISTGTKEVEISKYRGELVSSVSWQMIFGCSFSVFGNKLRFTLDDNNCNYYKFLATVTSPCGTAEEEFVFVYGGPNFRSQNSPDIPLTDENPLNLPNSKTGSDISGVSTFLNQPGKIKVYPNPFEDNFTLQVNAPQMNDYFIKVFDMAGKEVYKQTMNLQKGKNVLNIRLGQQISAGVYQLHIMDSKGYNQTQKIIHKP